MKKRMLYDLETTHGGRGGWHEVRIVSDDRKGAHGAAIFRWMGSTTSCEGGINMQWYGYAGHGRYDWYEGESDWNMTHEAFDARWEIMQDALDEQEHGATAKELRDAVAEAVHPKEEA